MANFYISGPKSLKLDDLDDVKGFSSAEKGISYSLIKSKETYEPVDVRDVKLRLNEEGGLEYVGDNELKIKIPLENLGQAGLELTELGLVAHPNVYQITFVKKGPVQPVNGVVYSTGDAEGVSFGNYVLPTNSLVVGGSCISYDVMRNPTPSQCRVSIVYNGNSTAMELSKPVTERSWLTLFNPKIRMNAGSLIGLKVIDTFVGAAVTSYQIYLRALPNITSTVTERKCTLPLSETTVVNPPFAVLVADVTQVPQSPIV